MTQKNKRFFPVIHCESVYQIRQNIELIRDCSDGVFLINHGKMNDDTFYRTVEQVVYHEQKGQGYSLNQRWLVGVNELKFNISDSRYDLKNAENIISNIKNIGAEMLWTDNAGCDENDQHVNYIHEIYDLLNHSNIQLFGGIHFKYQPDPELTLVDSIKLFSSYSSLELKDERKLRKGVITMSGKATGQAANLLSIKEANKICKDLGEPDRLRLAVASGINKDNLIDFFSYVDDFLVASSLLKDEANSNDFDGKKLSNFVSRWTDLNWRLNNGFSLE